MTKVQVSRSFEYYSRYAVWAKMHKEVILHSFSSVQLFPHGWNLVVVMVGGG